MFHNKLIPTPLAGALLGSTLATSPRCCGFLLLYHYRLGTP